MDGMLPPGDPKVDKRRKFIINFVYFVILFALSVVLVRYALPALTSFFIAAIVIFILRPVAKFMHEKLKLNYKVSSVILVLLFYATIGIGVVILILNIVDSLMGVIRQIPDFYKNTILPGLETALLRIDGFFDNFDFGDTIDVTETLRGAINKIGSALAELSTSIISKTPGIARSLSATMISIIICIIATAFGLIDFDLIRNFIHRQLSEEKSNTLKKVAHNLGAVLKKYIFSYALIMVITFAEIAVGLLIIGVDHPFLIAGLIAVFDILPIVGSGMVLFPWAVITLIIGNVSRGIGLLILWAVVIIVRNIIEPKIVGNQVGMHPLLTLFAMIAGNFIYGGIGILLLPVSIALIQNLNNAGVIHIYNHLEKQDIPDDGKGKIEIFFDKAGTVIFAFFKRVFTGLFRFIKKLWNRIFSKKNRKD